MGSFSSALVPGKKRHTDVGPLQIFLSCALTLVLHFLFSLEDTEEFHSVVSVAEELKELEELEELDEQVAADPRLQPRRHTLGSIHL